MASVALLLSDFPYLSGLWLSLGICLAFPHYFKCSVFKGTFFDIVSLGLLSNLHFYLFLNLRKVDLHKCFNSI